MFSQYSVCAYSQFDHMIASWAFNLFKCQHLTLGELYSYESEEQPLLWIMISVNVVRSSCI